MPDRSPVPSLSASDSSVRFSWRDQALHAARMNLLPGLALWAVGVLIVVAYYANSPVRPALEKLAMFKQAYGLLYAIPSTALFAGLIPWLIRSWLDARQITTRTQAWIRSQLLFLLIFWAIKGAEVEMFYRLQARLFGNDAELGTVVLKAFIDQFVYCPLWAVPTTVLAFQWADAGFAWKTIGPTLNRTWITRELLPVLIPNWLVWVPAVVLIYLLPLPLQLPIQNLVLCLWVLMLMLLTRSQDTGNCQAAKIG